MPTTVKEMVAAANAAVPRISEADDKARHAKGGTGLTARREPRERAASGTVPGALPIPRGLLEFRADPESPDRNAAFQKPVVITYCASGGRAALAGKLLQELGYTQYRSLRAEFCSLKLHG